MAAWVQATTRELSQSGALVNQSKPSVSASALSGDTGKPALGPKPHLMPKPFSLQRNATVRPIKAPKINVGRQLPWAASTDALDSLDSGKPASGETRVSAPNTSGTQKPKLNGTTNRSNKSAAPKPAPLSPKPALIPEPKSAPSRNIDKTVSDNRTGANTKPDVSAISVEDVKKVQPRSRAKSLGSQDQKALKQKPERETTADEVDAVVRVSSPCWPARNRLSMELTSRFESPSMPEREVSSVRRDSETSNTDKPLHSPLESKSSKPQLETGEVMDEEVSGCSIKRRISLLFDRSTASQCRDNFNKKDIAPAEISVDIKQRIKNLSLDTHMPRTRLPSTGAVKCQPYEKAENNSDEPSSSERSFEKPAQSMSVQNVPPQDPADKPTVRTTSLPADAVESKNGNTSKPEVRKMPRNASTSNTVSEKNVLLENKNSTQRSAGEPVANVEEEEDDEVEEDKENHVTVPFYRRVGIGKDLERKRQEEEEKHRKEEQLEKERKEQEMERQLEEERNTRQKIERRKEEERKHAEEERRLKDQRKQEEEKQRHAEEQRMQEEERQLEEERKREAERERQREQERLDREKQIEEQKRKIEEKREKERQREEQRLREEREKERLRKEKEMEEERQRIEEERQREQQRLRQEREKEQLKKDREMEEKRRIEEQRLRQEREKEEKLKKEREMEEKRRIEEEERLRQEREKEERLRKEREMEEKRRIEEEERLRQNREKEEILKKEREMEEKRRIEEEERLRQNREKEEILKKEREMEEKRRIEEEERLRQEREKEERLRKEREMEEKRRIEDQRLKEEREKEEKLKKERAMEEKRRLQEERFRQEKEKEERLKKKREMEEKRQIEEEERLRQEREKERLKKEREMEEKRRIEEEERWRQEREKERLKKEREMEEKRRIEEEERWRQEREKERLKKEREMEEKRRIEEEVRWRQEREKERLKKEREMEEKRRIEEEVRWRQEREKERLEMERFNVERMSEVPEKTSFDASPSLVSTSQATDVSPQLNEVHYDDFSVKPRRWGTRASRSSTPSPSREPLTDRLESSSSDPGSQGRNQNSSNEHEESSKQPQTVEVTESEPEDLSESETDFSVPRLDEVTSHEGQMKDCVEEEEQDTDSVIMESPEINDTADGHGPENKVSEALQRLMSPVKRRNASTDSDTLTVSVQDTEQLLFPESSAPLLDSSVFKSKADLGKKRSIKRSRPSRAIRQRAALPALTEATNPDWRFCDSTDAQAQCSNRQDSSEEEEPSKDTTSSPAPSQPKRVAVFPGMDQSALMAQLRRRSVIMEAEATSEGQTPPAVSARSPRTPTMSLGPRVLPPVNGRDSGSGSSPSWLLELKSKKRMSQPESDA